jgi:hypothetical protein
VAEFVEKEATNFRKKCHHFQQICPNSKVNVNFFFKEKLATVFPKDVSVPMIGTAQCTHFLKVLYSCS